MGRPGKEQLTVFLKRASMDGLREFAKREVLTTTAAVERAIGLLLGEVSIDPTDDRLAKVEAQVALLRAMVAGQAEREVVEESPKMDAPSEAAPTTKVKKSKPQKQSEAQLAITELAALGLGHKEIADALTARGFLAKSGKPIPRGDQRIDSAVKAAKARLATSAASSCVVSS